MATRSYGQFCSVAAALDAVGDRWSMLVVRELLAGPRRYTDLQAGLPGIATDMLASRLRGLESAGVVRRRELPAPASSKVYELTDDGRDLEPVLVELSRWGLRRLPEDTTGEFRLEWLELGLRALVGSARPDPPLHLRVIVDDRSVVLRIGHEGVEVVGDDDVEARVDVVIEGDPAAIVQLVTKGPERLDPSRVAITGDPASITRILELVAPERVAPDQRGGSST
jgi:DNA-binding HxlR family transcriptional regulator